LALHQVLRGVSAGGRRPPHEDRVRRAPVGGALRPQPYPHGQVRYLRAEFW
jgi:hypothetical protein